MSFLAKPLVALGFGAFFLCAATCTHFDELGSPLSLAPDWAAGLFMVGGAVVSRRDWSDGRTVPGCRVGVHGQSAICVVPRQP